MSLSKSQRAKVERALSHHERMSRAYFWKPAPTASGRRQMENRESFTVKFVHKGTRYAYYSDVACSCAHVYYAGQFTVDGDTKDVRAFKRLIA